MRICSYIRTMKKKTIDIGDYGVNPFVGALVIDVTEVVEMKDGNIESNYIERGEFAKVFRTVQGREVLFKMSGIGNKLFNYILHRLEPSTDVIKVTPVMFMDYLEIKSVKSFYNAALELQRLGIISPVAGVKHMYWINPAIVFVGSRPNKYPDNVVIKSTIKKR